MSTAIDTVSPLVSVNGSPLSAAHLDALVSMRIELGLCIIGRATLRFSDPGYSIAESREFAVGTTVELKVNDAMTSQVQTLMSGRVTGVSLEQRGMEQPELLVTVDDGASRLTRAVKPTTYVNMSYSDVIKKLAFDAGMSADVPSEVGTSAPSEYLLQTGSALSYIDRIAQRMGMIWWADADELVLKAAGTSIGTATLTAGLDLIDFSVRASGLRPTKVNVTGWDPAQQQVITEDVEAKAPDGASTFVTGYVGTGPVSGLLAGEASTGDCAPASQAEASALAASIVGDAADGAVIARGTSWGTARLKPAVTVQLSGAGPASGSYLLSEVEHVYSSRGFYTRWVAGPRRPIGLVDTLGRAVPDPGLSVSGLVVGVVSNNGDDQNLGRVKVKYTSLAGEIESAWARVVSLGAGAGRGAVFQPEVNDEVLLGFEHADSRRPVVIGALYSKVKGLPEANKIVADGKVGYRRITSRLNHVLEFADGSGPETQHVLLQVGTAQTHKLRLGADAFDVEVADGKPVTIKAGSATFAINASGEVEISGKKVTIKADTDVVIQGLNVTTKASAKAAVQGTQIEVKGSATTDVEASAMLTLKGGLVKIN
ncbi:MAG: phage baseplate assembly protein V [Jatrophihabitantaceae bacterium]